MNSQEYRNLQEAYLDVYENEQLDEMPYRVFTKNNKGEEVSVGGTYATRKTARTRANKGDETDGGVTHSVRKVDEETDIFNYVMEHLLTEGYADTNENALVIMANMSEEWRESILTEAGEEALRKEFSYGKRKKIKPTKSLKLPSAGDASTRKGSRDYGDDRPSSTRGLPAAGYN